MKELVSPFVRLWDWVSATGGLPGQLLFGCLFVVVILGVGVWFSNRGVK
jgi:hypothetical protein